MHQIRRSRRPLGYDYDANGNRTRITHPDGTYFVTWYDGLNRAYYLQANGLDGLAYTFYTPHGAPAYTGRPGTAAIHAYDEVQRPTSRTLLFLNGNGNAAWRVAAARAPRRPGNPRSNS